MNTIIVIPTLDESDNIPKLFNALKVLKKINYKICFVDGSKDNRTINEIKKYFKNNSKILKEKKNISKISSRCAASRMGFEWAVKQKFCELNGIKLVEIYPEDKLSKELFKSFNVIL